jgi:superfamily II DNA or RNA helicase
MFPAAFLALTTGALYASSCSESGRAQLNALTRTQAKKGKRRKVERCPPGFKRLEDGTCRRKKCPPGTHRNRKTKKCDENYTVAVWEKVPGDKGFNEYATELMKAEPELQNLGIECPVPGGPLKLQAYQKTASWLVHPLRPVHRVLVVHRTGAGKTLTMIKICENFYTDSRPKVLIFPNAEVRDNFYQELMFFPNPYKDYVEKQLGSDLTWNTKTKAKVIDLLAGKGRLRRMGEPNELYAPLRAFTYASAGGNPVFRKRDPLPIFKILYDGENPYSNKIVIMDEVHNLVAPTHEMKKYKSKLDRLREALQKSQKTVLVGLTATPIADGPQDWVRLMRVLKGPGANERTDEGYVLYFNSRPSSVFASIPGGTNAKVVQVPLSGENLKTYVEKAKTLKDVEKLAVYNNMAVYYTQVNKPKFKQMLKKNPPGAASKMFRVAQTVFERCEKQLIIVHRKNGIKAMMAVLDAYASSGMNYACKKGSYAMLYDRETPTQRKKNDPTSATAILKRFNAANNIRGEHLRVLVIDAKYYSEGVSFKDCRLLHLVDVPESWKDYKQRIGRVIRLCGHNRLPKDERVLELFMYIATIDPNSTIPVARGRGKTRRIEEVPVKKVPTADEILLKRIHEERDALELMIQAIANLAVDKEILRPYVE